MARPRNRCWSPLAPVECRFNGHKQHIHTHTYIEESTVQFGPFRGVFGKQRQHPLLLSTSTPMSGGGEDT